MMPLMRVVIMVMMRLYERFSAGDFFLFVDKLYWLHTRHIF